MRHWHRVACCSAWNYPGVSLITQSRRQGGEVLNTTSQPPLFIFSFLFSKQYLSFYHFWREPPGPREGHGGKKVGVSTEAP